MDASTYPILSKQESTHWWFTGRREIFYRAFEDHVQIRSAKILDVGCGVGAMLPMLKKFGDVTGVDNNGDAVRYAQGRPYAAVVNADAADLPFTSNTFDVVVATDLIEHIRDEMSVLNELIRVLKPGGVLFISTAAFQFLWSDLDELSHHYRRYTKKSLLQTITKINVTPLLIRYYNVFLAPIITVIRMFERILSHKKPINFSLRDLRTPSAAINMLLRRVLASEKYFLKIPFPFGISLFGIFQKPHGK